MARNVIRLDSEDGTWAWIERSKLGDHLAKSAGQIVEIPGLAMPPGDWFSDLVED